MKQPPQLETTANVLHGILSICGIHIHTMHIFPILCHSIFGIFRRNSGVNQSLIPHTHMLRITLIVMRVGEFTFICNYFDHHHGAVHSMHICTSIYVCSRKSRVCMQKLCAEGKNYQNAWNGNKIVVLLQHVCIHAYMGKIAFYYTADMKTCMRLHVTVCTSPSLCPSFSEYVIRSFLCLVPWARGVRFPHRMKRDKLTICIYIVDSMYI